MRQSGGKKEKEWNESWNHVSKLSSVCRPVINPGILRLEQKTKTAICRFRLDLALGLPQPDSLDYRLPHASLNPQ